MEKAKILSGAVLKYIAMFTMVLDHVDKGIFLFLPPSTLVGTLSDIFSVLGRFAFPLFCFLLVEGFYNTHSKIAYLRNLLVFAIISEIPFNLFFSAELWAPGAQNIFFTLAIALAVIWSIDEIRKRTRWWGLGAAAIVILGCIAATFGGVDYGHFGVLVPVVFYLLRSKPLIASIVGYLIVWKQLWSLPAFLLTNLYNGKRGKQMKWLNYWFYPVHLLIIGLVEVFVIG